MHEESDLPRARSALVRRAVAFMEEDPAAARVATICARIGTSRSYLHRRFVAEVGITPGAYLRQIRLERALRLLHERPAATAEQIAAEVGYSSVAALDRAFRSETGANLEGIRLLARRCGEGRQHDTIPDDPR